MAFADLAELSAPKVSGRIGRLRERLEDAGCGALLVTKLENIRYLSAFTGSAAMLLVTPETALLTTDSRYRDQATAQLDSTGVTADIEVARPDGQLAAIASAVSGISRVGLEASVATWSFVLQLEGNFASELVATRGVVEALRVLKDPGELARIERACDIADVALAQTKQRLVEGPTESEFAAELEYEMRRRGAEGPAFETIVASGPNSAMPHARPTDRTIIEGDLVVVDFGATVDGYRSDMTRTFTIGEVDAHLVEMYDAVFAAQRAGLDAIEPGSTGAMVDSACSDVLTEAGFGPAFLHATGHGVGLEIHEAPAVAQGATGSLPPDAIITVEPGAYLAGRGGVRIEDTVVVTETGCRVLTKSTKDSSV